MELTPRKKAILEAVVNSYVLTGEPVGSKALASAIENSPSSATIRNEMNELCSLGLLFQPHVSAGRVPTSLGFKVYVSSIMQTSGLDERTKRYLDNARLYIHLFPMKAHILKPQSCLCFRKKPRR